MLFGSQAEVQFWIVLFQGRRSVIGSSHGARVESFKHSTDAYHTTRTWPFQSQPCGFSACSCENFWSIAVPHLLCLQDHQYPCFYVKLAGLLHASVGILQSHRGEAAQQHSQRLIKLLPEQCAAFFHFSSPINRNCLGGADTHSLSQPAVMAEDRLGRTTTVSKAG